MEKKPTREDYFEKRDSKTIVYKKGRFVKLRDGANLLEVTPNKIVKVLSLDPEDFSKIQIVYVDKSGKMKPSIVKKTDVFSQSTIRGFENQIDKPKAAAKKTDAKAKKQTDKATTAKPTSRKVRKSDTKQQQKATKPTTTAKKQEEPKKPESPFIKKPFYVATTFKKDGSTEATKGLNLKAICEHCGLNYKGTKDKLAYKLRLKASTPFEALQNKTNYYTATNKSKEVVIVERF